MKLGMILGSNVKRNVGDKGEAIEIKGKIIKQPFVAIREATFEEYVIQCREYQEIPNPRNKYFYEVSTD